MLNRITPIVLASICISFAISDRVEAVDAPGSKSTERITHSDISYYGSDMTDAYAKERGKLDLHLPKGEKDFPVIVWFHGGGIRNGDKAGASTEIFSKRFAESGIAVAAANYRLSPKVNFPAYLEDCAAAVKWTLDNIENYGGSKRKVFVGGHSAGGYLAMMIGVDPAYLENKDVELKDIAGFVPVSGQMVTHSTVRSEKGISETQIVVDAGAPLFYAEGFNRPILILAADNDEPNRLEENILMASALRTNEGANVSFLRVDDRNHGSIIREMANSDDPGAKAIEKFVNEISGR